MNDYHILFIFILIWVIFGFIYIVPKMLYSKPEIFNKDIERIRNEGVLLFKKNSGGRIGVVNFSKYLLTISVYDKGIILTPTILFKECCLLKTEIISLVDKKIFFTNSTEIQHNSKNLDKMILVYCKIPYIIRNQLLNSN